MIKTYELLTNEDLTFEETDIELLRSPNDKVVMSRTVYKESQKQAHLRKKFKNLGRYSAEVDSEG